MQIVYKISIFFLVFFFQENLKAQNKTTNSISEIINEKYILVTNGKNYGVIDINGKVIVKNILKKQSVINSRYDVDVFEDIIFGIDDENRIGVAYNLETSRKLPVEFNDYVGFSEGIAILSKGGKKWAVNKKGLKLFDLPKNATETDDFGQFNSGLARIVIIEEKRESKYLISRIRRTVYIDTLGHIAVSNNEFEDYSDFSEGLALVSKKIEGIKKWGFINTQGKLVIECKFTKKPTSFSNGYSRVRAQNKKYGFLNKKGDVVIEPQYVFATGFYENNALVSKEKYEWHIINRENINIYSFNKVSSFEEKKDFSSKKIDLIERLIKGNPIKAILKDKGYKVLIIDKNQNILFNYEKKFHFEGGFKNKYCIISIKQPNSHNTLSGIIDANEKIILVEEKSQF